MPNPAQARILSRWEAWRELHAERLERFHLDVANEIASTVRERYLAGNFAPMSDEDRRLCAKADFGRARVPGRKPRA
jgi:hypothetical protein